MKQFKSLAMAFAIALAGLTATAQTKKINLTQSKINWVGKKITGKHEGTINFKEGSLTFKSKKLTAGSFVVDMNSINTTDLSGEGKNKLDGHLKADDFFGVEKFSTAKLVFKTVKATNATTYAVTADLTIKGITKPVSFDFVVNKNTATTTLKVDRTKYDIKYGSGSFFDGLGDRAISDEFELNVVAKF